MTYESAKRVPPVSDVSALCVWCSGVLGVRRRAVSETLQKAMAVLAAEVAAKGWGAAAAVEPQSIRSDQVPPPLTANASCVYILCLERSGRLYCGACPAPCCDRQTACYGALDAAQSAATIHCHQGAL